MRRDRSLASILSAGVGATLIACGGALAPIELQPVPDAATDASAPADVSAPPDALAPRDVSVPDDVSVPILEDAQPNAGPPPTSGTLDTSFGTNGVVTIPIDPLTIEQPGWSWPSPWLAGLAIQPDGKIVYGGHGFLQTPTASWPMILGRLNPDGTADPTFNPSGPLPGTLVTDPPGDSNFAISGQGSVVVLPSGDIVVGGYLSVPGDPPIPMVAEFTPAGALDPTFAGTGLVALEGNSLNTYPGGLLVQPDGKIILAGELGASGAALVRLLPTGTPDLTFDPPPTGGETAGFDTFAAYPNVSFGPIGLLPNGDILASLGTGSASPLPLALAISSTSGALDAAFGAGGTLSKSSFAGVPQGLAVESDGRAIFVGSTGTAIELAQFANGQIDLSFGDGGIAAPSLPGGSASAGSIALAANGALVIGATLPGEASIGVVRYTAGGVLDTTFAETGYAGVPPMAGASIAGPTQVVIDSRGRIVYGTIVANEAGVPIVQLARVFP
jgi:uncharacterized delta-60 repeat protein